MELIDRNMVKTMILGGADSVRSAKEGLELVAQVINDAPTILDIDTSEATWEFNSNDNVYTCSRCGWCCTFVTGNTSLDTFLFCPCCGSMMADKNNSFLKRRKALMESEWETFDSEEFFDEEEYDDEDGYYDDQLDED